MHCIGCLALALSKHPFPLMDMTNLSLDYSQADALRAVRGVTKRYPVYCLSQEAFSLAILCYATGETRLPKGPPEEIHCVYSPFVSEVCREKRKPMVYSLCLLTIRV